MRFHRYEGDREQVQTDLENSWSQRRYGYGLVIPTVEMLLPLVMEEGRLVIGTRISCCWVRKIVEEGELMYVRDTNVESGRLVLTGSFLCWR